MSSKNLGNAIRELLTIKKIPKRMMAAELGIPETGLYKRFNGHIEWRFFEIIKIVKFLDMTIDELLDFCVCDDM